jgi:hypothetical protein
MAAKKIDEAGKKHKNITSNANLTNVTTLALIKLAFIFKIENISYTKDKNSVYCCAYGMDYE